MMKMTTVTMKIWWIQSFKLALSECTFWINRSDGFFSSLQYFSCFAISPPSTYIKCWFVDINTWNRLIKPWFILKTKNNSTIYNESINRLIISWFWTLSSVQLLEGFFSRYLTMIVLFVDRWLLNVDVNEKRNYKQLNTWHVKSSPLIAHSMLLLIRCQV